MITNVVLRGFGLCQVANEAAEPSQAGLTGHFLHSDTLFFQLETDSIQLRSGLRFGIAYSLGGTEEDNAEVFTVRIIHPRLVNPVTDQSSTEVIETKAGCIDESNFDYFHFEYEWEMQPGKWLFQVIQSDKLLLEKEFNLYS